MTGLELEYRDQRLLAGSAQLQTVVVALERLVRELPGLSLVAAIVDPEVRSGDLVIGDHDGEIAVVLGLAERYRRELRYLLELARAGEPGPPAGLEYDERAVATARVIEPERTAPDADARFRLMIEAAPISLVLIDRHGLIEYISPAVGEQFGYERSAQLIGQPALSFLHPDDHRRTESYAKLLRSGQAGETRTVVRVRREDGSYGRAEASVRMLAEPLRGEFGGAVIALRETSKIRSGLEETLVTERRQRALANAADCGTAIVAREADGRGAVIDANIAFGQLMGGTAGQLVGHCLTDLVAESDAERVRDALRAVAASGQPQRLEARLASRQARMSELTIRLDRDSGDPPTQLGVTVRDITEQRGLVAELTHTVDHLQEVNHELAEFARVTAHDLAAPLRAVSGLMDLITPSAFDPELNEIVAAVRNAISRMQAMIDSVIGYAQTQGGKPARVAVDLNSLLTQVRETLTTEIADSGAKITSAKLPSVLGDPHQLERVFANLIANALKYAGDRPPRVHVGATHEGDAWRIAVSDEGIGVEPGDRERIFALFERAAEGPAVAGETGRGIGLATCRRIIEMHGGRIWVEPNQPSGSSFQFTIRDLATAD